jgi:Flp pilus assembly protein TadG
MELAVCMPILLVLILGTVEACGMIYLKQTLCVAAYEGARTAVLPGKSASDVIQKCDSILISRGVHAYTVTVTPNDFENAPIQTWLTIRVTAPASANSAIVGIFSDSLVIGAEATMMKEY